MEFLKSVSSIDVKPPAVELPRQIIYGFDEEEEDILNGYKIRKKIKRDEPNGWNKKERKPLNFISHSIREWFKSDYSI